MTFSIFLPDPGPRRPLGSPGIEGQGIRPAASKAVPLGVSPSRSNIMRAARIVAMGFTLSFQRISV